MEGEDGGQSALGDQHCPGRGHQQQGHDPRLGEGEIRLPEVTQPHRLLKGRLGPLGLPQRPHPGDDDRRPNRCRQPEVQRVQQSGEPHPQVDGPQSDLNQIEHAGRDHPAEDPAGDPGPGSQADRKPYQRDPHAQGDQPVEHVDPAEQIPGPDRPAFTEGPGGTRPGGAAPRHRGPHQRQGKQR
jgi:hypothetical protein